MDESRIDSKAAHVARGLIRIYQVLTIWVPHRCRFAPSCSEYAREALGLHGFVRGILLGSRRVLKCHPWNPGGHDPVPESVETTVFHWSHLWKRKIYS